MDKIQTLQNPRMSWISKSEESQLGLLRTTTGRTCLLSPGGLSLLCPPLMCQLSHCPWNCLIQKNQVCAPSKSPQSRKSMLLELHVRSFTVGQGHSQIASWQHKAGIMGLCPTYCVGEIDSLHNGGDNPHNMGSLQGWALITMPGSCHFTNPSLSVRWFAV